jgi:hypothetical protein
VPIPEAGSVATAPGAFGVCTGDTLAARVGSAAFAGGVVGAALGTDVVCGVEGA